MPAEMVHHCLASFSDSRLAILGRSIRSSLGLRLGDGSAIFGRSSDLGWRSRMVLLEFGLCHNGDLTVTLTVTLMLDSHGCVSRCLGSELGLH